MPNPKSQRERERARQFDREARRMQQLRRAQRRRAMIGMGGVIVIVAVVVGVIIAGTKGKESSANNTTTTTDPLSKLGSSTTSSTVPGPPASLPTVAPGASIAGQAPCPAPDGSSARTTSFTGPLPTCISPDLTYDAVIKTTVGEMKFLLNPKEGQQTVNSFVFLAGYHYWDGAPLTSIKPSVTFIVGNPVPGGPGYQLPNETPPQGTIFPVGRLAMVGPGSTVDPGIFQVALGEEAAGLPKQTPTFGIMLDGLETLQAIRKAGSEAGTPTGTAVTIESIVVTASPPPSTTTTAEGPASR